MATDTPSAPTFPCSRHTLHCTQFIIRRRSRVRSLAFHINSGRANACSRRLSSACCTFLSGELRLELRLELAEGWGYE